MIEACIECKCIEFNLPDVNIKMQKGDVIWLDESRARASKDITHALQIGAVSVRWAERCREMKTPTPPWINRNATKGSRATPAAPAQVSEDVLSQAKAAAEQTVKDHMSELRRLIADEIRQSLRTGVPSVRQLDSGQVVIDAGAPLFIPTNLVDSSAKSVLGVKSEASETPGLDDATSALRSVRKGHKKTASQES